MHKNSLPVRDDVELITYWRKPTPGELVIGFGALHHRDFSIDECCHAGTRIMKVWFIADDGLRYYR